MAVVVAGAGPAAGTFRGFVAEGMRLSRRGEHGKALACFQRALTLRAGDKDCLVARSECHRRLGDLDNALKDAEASLENDKTFAKGLYQKAETLYTMGDFEFALVFYHRGNRVRPDQQKFRLGIQKSEEAILNGIATLSYDDNCEEDVHLLSGTLTRLGQGRHLGSLHRDGSATAEPREDLNRSMPRCNPRTGSDPGDIEVPHSR